MTKLRKVQRTERMSANLFDAIAAMQDPADLLATTYSNISSTLTTS